MRGSFEQPSDAEMRRDAAEVGDTAANQEPLRLAWPEAVCSQVRPRLEALHDGALGDADERFVREHVANCARCAARLGRYDEIDSLLRRAPAPRVGPELRAHLYARIADAEQRRGAFAVLGSWRKQINEQDARERTSYRKAVTGSSASHGAFGIGGSGLVANWINGMAAIAVVALLALLFNTLTGMPYRTDPSAQPAIRGQVIATLPALPTFSDYRAAYVDANGQLRIVSADGVSTPRITQPGPTLPNTGLLTRVPAAPYYDVAVSQNGRYLAYVEGDASVRDAATPLPTGGPVAIVNLATGTVLSMPITANDLTWSPDNRLLAAPDVTSNFAAIDIIDATTGIVRQLKGSVDGSSVSMQLMAGWIDSTHIEVFYQVDDNASTPIPGASTVSQPAGSTKQSLGSMDILSGAITYLTGLPDPSDVFLSPDGSKVLLAPNYSTTMARVIDTSTGLTHELTNISEAFKGKFAALGPGDNWSLHSAWQPGTGHVLALSLSTGSSQKPGIWLLNLDQDTATLVKDNAYPLAWFPGSSQALITCDPPQADSTGAYLSNEAGVGSKLYTLAPVVPGGDTYPLAGGMVAFLGLVRTGA